VVVVRGDGDWYFFVAAETGSLPTLPQREFLTHIPTHERKRPVLRSQSRMDSTTAAATAAAAPAPVLLVTNDDGIDAPGLRFLVDRLVAAGRYRVLVCAPDT
jgi:hypothetical protein